MSSDYQGSTESNHVQITEGKYYFQGWPRPCPLFIVPDSFLVDEAAVYDRQIRLWGLEAQQR